MTAQHIVIAASSKALGLSASGMIAYRALRFDGSSHFVVGNPQIDHVWNQRRNFAAIQQVRIRCDLDIRAKKGQVSSRGTTEARQSYQGYRQ